MEDKLDSTQNVCIHFLKLIFKKLYSNDLYGTCIVWSIAGGVEMTESIREGVPRFFANTTPFNLNSLVLKVCQTDLRQTPRDTYIDLEGT